MLTTEKKFQLPLQSFILSDEAQDYIYCRMCLSSFFNVAVCSLMIHIHSDSVVSLK